MAKYKIPQTFIPGFTFLANLDIKQVEQIRNALAEFPVGTGPNTFRNTLASKLNEIDGINNIAQVIFSFGSFLNDNEGDFDKDEIANDLVEAFKVANAKKEVEETNVNSLAPKIKLLLTNCDNLKLSFKAFRLQSENANLYRNSRVVSDIRMVFNDDLADKKRHGIIVHSLKIEFMKNSKEEEFYLSLDTSDLKKLKDILDRALQKEIQLKEDYSGMVSFIEINE